MGVKLLKYRTTIYKHHPKISKISPLLLGVVFLLVGGFSSFLGAQERMTEFNNKFDLFDSQHKLEKLKDFYFQKYQQKKTSKILPMLVFRKFIYIKKTL